jgi:hypothetical protein
MLPKLVTRNVTNARDGALFFGVEIVHRMMIEERLYIDAWLLGILVGVLDRCVYVFSSSRAATSIMKSDGVPEKSLVFS